MRVELKSFKKTSYLTLIVLFLLIGVGGLVRVTDSGMGCPDWPKCFGLWVPPTCECQLPENYHDIYKDHGYPEGVNFDPVKTWIEYLNRLLGVFTGIVVLVNLVVAFAIRKEYREIFIGSLVCFLLVVAEGAIGAIVVKLNLQQQTVSLHYFIAMLIVCSLIFSIAAMRRANWSENATVSSKTSKYIVAALGISMIQILSGAHLRGLIENLNGITAFEWLHLNDKAFVLHRFYAVLVVISNLILWQQLKGFRFAQFAIKVIGVGIVLQIITGTLMSFFNFPQLAQVLHILLPAIIFCGQFYIVSFIFLNKDTTKVSG